MARKIYKNQTALSMRLDTKIDLSTAQTILMKYVKPDGTAGQWTALPISVGSSIVKYDITGTSDLDQAGIWKRWVHITFIDGKVAPGDVVTFTVCEEGK